MSLKGLIHELLEVPLTPTEPKKGGVSVYAPYLI